jgi:hypothetical protein
MHFDVVVVGAGAAGILAATRAAERGRKVLLLEKNGKPGVKILMSGGTRCNLTHATDSRGIADAFASTEQGHFLRSPLAAFPPDDLVAWVEAEGLPTKVEPGGKIFPVTDRATDVLAALLRRLQRSGCGLALDEALVRLEPIERGIRLTTPARTFDAASVIVTTGGKSYPRSGTSGDGYAWMEALGHTVVPTRPALTPLVARAAWIRELSGVSADDVRLRIVEPGSKSGGGSCLGQRRESLLFTHFGLSGPAALDVSGAVSAHPRPLELCAVCDFAPDLSEEAVDEALRQQCAEHGARSLSTLPAQWMARRLGEAIVTYLGLNPEQRCAELSRTDRRRLAAALKRLEIPLEGTRGFAKAEVTAGGVALGEVDSRTMRSKLVPGLFIAGEILDVDGPIGGYNFQAAFSTGFVAGENA